MSRAIVVVGLLAALGGCRTRVCAPGTILVELARPGASSTADQIAVDVMVGTDAPLHAQVPVTPGGSTGTFQIDFAGKYPANQMVTIVLSALAAGDVVATVDVALTLGPTCDKIGLTFADATDGGDDAAPDLSCIPTTTSCGAADCGQIVDECGGIILCPTPCSVSAIVPRIANAGDTIMVEGTLSGATTVTLPGGVAANVTLLGANRGYFNVPTGVTAGGVTIHTGNTDFDAGDLRRAAFTLGLQPWNANYAQAGGGRQPTTLLTARQGHAVIANRLRIYVFGGRASSAGTVYKSVERIRLNADGTLSSSVTAGPTMNTARTGLQVAGTFSHIYAIGGFDGSVALKSIESTTINSDGSLAVFTNESIALSTAREGFSTTIVGSWLYAIGGTNGSGVYLDTIERAPINADGSLGAFEAVSGKLVTARSQHATFATKKSLFVVNGLGSGGSALGSVEEAPILGDGSLGAFGASTASLPGGVTGEIAGTRWGARIFLRTPTGSYLASVADDGAVGAFADTGIAPLGTMGGSGARVVVARDGLYEIGGAGSTVAVASVTRAGLQFGAQLGGFTSSSNVLPAGVAQSASMVFGDTVYLFGGADDTGGPGATATTIYKATISPDDTLGTFAAAVVPLPAALSEVAVAYAEKSVYFIGGYDGAGPTGGVYQIGVGTDGSLVTPTPNPPPPIATLTVPRRAARAVVLAGQLCVLGGATAAGPSKVVECATITQGTGALGTFSSVTDDSSVAVALSLARSSPSVAVIAGQVVAIGGTNTTASNGDGATSEGGLLDTTVANKPIGTNFAINVNAPLPGPRTQAAPVIVGNQIFLLGGGSNGTLSNHDLAADAVSFNSAFAQAGDLVTKRRAATAVVVGNQAYVIGGAIDAPALNGTTTSIEAAPLQ